MSRIAAVSILALLLAGCGDSKPAAQTDTDKRNAEGEVLGGSISDSMLPLATVTSQSPPLRESVAGETAQEPGDTASAAPEETPPEDAPAAPPTPADEAT